MSMTIDSRRSISVLLQNRPSDAGQPRGAELRDVVTTDLLHGAVTDHNSDRDGCGWI